MLLLKERAWGGTALDSDDRKFAILFQCNWKCLAEDFDRGILSGCMDFVLDASTSICRDVCASVPLATLPRIPVIRLWLMKGCRLNYSDCHASACVNASKITSYVELFTFVYTTEPATVDFNFVIQLFFVSWLKFVRAVPSTSILTCVSREVLLDLRFP
jgi:hypothetical protein